MLRETPSLFQRFAESLERRAQKWQGKGAGGHSVLEEVRIALPLLPPVGAIIVDGGANNGLWSRVMLQAAGSRLSRLVAVEPSVHNHADILAIGDPRLTLVRAALGPAPGQAVLHMDQPGSGLASLSQRNLDHVGLTMDEVETVDLITLDQLAEGEALERVDFLKLDIEGHEWPALQGAKRLLAERRIRALSFEFGGANLETRSFFRDFWVLLGESRFRVWRIAPGRGAEPIRHYHERLECFATTNYLAIQTGPNFSKR
jgi:FkbM family methyltransferase